MRLKKRRKGMKKGTTEDAITVKLKASVIQDKVDAATLNGFIRDGLPQLWKVIPKDARSRIR